MWGLQLRIGQADTCLDRGSTDDAAIDAICKVQQHVEFQVEVGRERG